MTTYSLEDVRGMGDGQPQTFSLGDVQSMQQDVFKRQMLARETNDLSSGIRRGVRDVIDTGAEGLAWVYDKLTGADPAAGERARVKEMNQRAKAEWQVGTSGEILPHVQRFLGNVIGTTPVTQAAGAAVGAAGLPALGQAIGSAGMTTGRVLPPVLDMSTRMTGGGINGAMSAGMLDPNTAASGALLGAALPPALKGLNMAATAVARPSAAAAVPDSVLDAARAAHVAGYVIPPTQVRPTMANRVVEGMAGKISTAQNASAMNQPVTNQLAMRAIGADALSPEGLAAVRAKANNAYDALGQVGALQVDDTFRDSLQRIGSGSQQFRKDFPGLVNRDVDTLVEGISSRKEFDAQSAIEAIKRLRYDGGVNKAAQDPERRALGSAQMKIAGSLEDLIDRNLKQAGSPELLAAYRDARTTLAKVYDVEKALNSASGNVNAQRLAELQKKGRPLTGDLKTIADFASQFKTAAQPVDRMGSLPQLSPLDFGFAGAAQTPAGLLLRPGARSLALSPMVQNRLGIKPGTTAADRVAGLLEQVDPLAPLVYRSVPLGASQ